MEVSGIKAGALFECGLSVNRIFKFASIFWLVTSEKLAATPHHQSFKDSFHQAYDHDQLHMVVFCQFSLVMELFSGYIGG